MAKLIVSSCYIKNSTHFLNYLEYAGEKLEAQSVTLQNGETLTFSPDEILTLGDDVKSVNISFKDGHNKSITPQRYSLLTEQKKQTFDAADLYDTDNKIKKEFINPSTYLDYIATRPSVEKISGEGHGLFGLSGACDIVEQKNLAEQYGKNIKWSHIVSMKREDAQRTGYDNRAAWEALIKAKAPAIAKQYNISMENLVLNCAYHDKDNHPHIHLFIYSKDSREAFVKGGKEALAQSSQKVKSLLFNEIFKDDVSYLKTQKNEREHTMEARLKELSATIAHKSHVPPAILISKTEALAQKLQGEKGRKFYGYLPPALKQEVNNVLRCAIEQDTVLCEAFNEYMKTYRIFVEQYIDEPQKADERIHQIRERLLSPQAKGDSTVLQNIIIKGVLHFNEAIKDKTVSKKEDDKESIGIFEAAENYVGDNDYKILDNKNNALFHTFKKQLQKSLRSIYTDTEKEFAFKAQEQLADVSKQLLQFDFKSFDKLSEQSRQDVISLIKTLIEKDGDLKQSYDDLIDGHKEIFNQFENPEDLIKGFKEYLLNDGKYTSSSLTSSVILFSCNENIKYYEWRNQNRYNDDVSKKLYKTLLNCYTDNDDISTGFQQKIFEIKNIIGNTTIDAKKLEEAQAELLHYAIDNDKDFALEVACLMRQQNIILSKHCFDMAQYEKEYMAELTKRFFEPGKFGYTKLHHLAERFAQNSDSYKFNARIKQCDTYKEFNKELFKALNRVYGYEKLEPENLTHSLKIQKSLENLHVTINSIKKELEEKEGAETEADVDILKQTKISDEFKARYSHLNKQAKLEIKDIIKTLVEIRPELKALYNKLIEEYNQVVGQRAYYGEDNHKALMDDFAKRFYEPEAYDTKSSHNIIFKYAENIEKNKIVSEYYANNKIIRLQHQEQNRQRQEQNQLNKTRRKQQQILHFAVKAMLYGLCSSFAQSAEDTASTMGHRNRKRRNITLCKSDADRSPREEHGQQQSEKFAPTQF